MVKCEICSVYYKRITELHLRKHNITAKEYQIKFPGSELISQETLEKYRQGTKNYLSTLTKEEKSKRYKNRVYSAEGRAAILKTLEYGRSCIKYDDPKRGLKIAASKKQWWSNLSAEERSEFIRQRVVPQSKKSVGEEEYYRRLRENGLKGNRIVMDKGKSGVGNKFELEMYDRIREAGYECIEQFEVDGWFFDCYIPSKNLIIEFDGDYWHPRTMEDCVSSRLKRQFNIDRRKEQLASSRGYSLARVRQSEKHKLEDILNL